jgi:hypothetical protein
LLEVRDDAAEAASRTASAMGLSRQSPARRRTAEADPAQSATGQGWTAEKGQADSTKVV